MQRFNLSRLKVSSWTKDFGAFEPPKPSQNQENPAKRPVNALSKSASHRGNPAWRLRLHRRPPPSGRPRHWEHAWLRARVLERGHPPRTCTCAPASLVHALVSARIRIKLAALAKVNFSQVGGFALNVGGSQCSQRNAFIELCILQVHQNTTLGAVI